MKFLLISFLIFFLSASSSFSQDIPFSEYDFPYIRYDVNRIDFPGDSAEFETLFSKFDNLILKGEGKVNIVHFGGSHIQAGIYSGQTRKRLQNMYPGLTGGRGLVFPYRMSRSNAPNNYNITWTGKWETCTNVQFRRSCSLGLLGVAAVTTTTDASIRIVGGKNYGHYETDKIRIFHDFGEQYFKIIPDSLSISDYKLTEFPERGFTLIETNQVIDTVYLRLLNTDSLQTEFTLYGIALDNHDSGIVYHDAGINGASLPSFLKCNLLETQLAEIQPDLIIISLGTNDTYTKKFDTEFYRNNYLEFISRIRKAQPETAILMTVPNDAYYRRRYPNKNVALAQTVIYEVAKQQNCGVWDFYEIMGGLNSSSLWHKDALMAYDRIHFSASGYLIKGDLLYEAIQKAYDNHIDKKYETAHKNQ